MKTTIIHHNVKQTSYLINMKYQTATLLSIYLLSSNNVITQAFVTNPFGVSSQAFASATPSLSTRVFMLESDFASAMPEKPKQTKKEKLIEQATNFIVDIENKLADGVEAVPELEALRQARDDDADEKTLAAKMYELMIEQGMCYDQDQDTGMLTPTNFDIKNNLDIPEVKSEFAHLYKYGMNICMSGIVDVDDVKNIVKKRLIARTGLTPEEFDKWLGY